ncbi:DUF6735 family protein [Halorussus sp. MSC15.2]|uniref:DUF6735 family protein n=1 Tax=Halorussus sp. MSC15.2 TaxID=2283638 RepID=UPI0013D64FB1|nr:DUF6735 family protein [Halorussus sp. MSC15.2]NEU57866.1 hypothetical protein [Halorussus sp. MSC15.2]
MGHRALLAYRREGDDERDDTDPADSDGDTTDSTDAADDGPATYDLHRSHWGGADFALANRLTAESPYAADTPFAVDPSPVATDRSLSHIAANALDFLHHEAFYRVEIDYETTPFHVLWFGLEADSDTVERSETVGHGALVEARPEEDDRFSGWFCGTKAVVGDAVDWGALSREEAAEYLARRVETRADDRTVILPD